MSTHSKLYSAGELSKLPVLNCLSIPLLEEMVPHIKVRSYEKNAFIYQPGESSQEIHLLMNGIVKNGVFLTNGKEMIQHLIKPMEYFGFEGLTGAHTRQHYTKVLSGSCTVLSIPNRLINHMMVLHDGFSEVVVELVARTLRRLEKRLEILLTSDVRARIDYFLAENCSVEQIDNLMKEGLTQQDIATMIGATRQTVALILNELKKDNKISFNRKKSSVRPGASAHL